MVLLTVGARVHCILYGGKDGVVYAIHGEQQPDTVQSLAGVVTCGGNAYIDIVWEDGTESHKIPESVIRGVQWRILPGIADDNEIRTMREYALQENTRRSEELAQQVVRFGRDAQSLRENTEYGYLQQGNDRTSGKLAAKNIRIELKKRFPETKFSVRKEHYGSVYISWVDGPTTKDVKAVVDKYAAGSFDSSEDTYRDAVTPWNAVFGGSKYVSTSREYSTATLQAAIAVVKGRFQLGSLKVAQCADGEAYLSGDQRDQRLVYEYLEKTGRFRDQ
jgi:hypothetical protein